MTFGNPAAISGAAVVVRLGTENLVARSKQSLSSDTAEVAIICLS
jgi:hypothetical protein